MTPVVVIGGGPAGLAAAIGFAQRDVPTHLVERRSFPIDKPCGEGLLPNGVAALARLGVPEAALAAAGYRLAGIRYQSAHGRVAEASFVGETGIGLSRTCLSTLLVARARTLPALTISTGTAADVRVGADGRPLVSIGRETLRPRLLVAADGLASRVRRVLGMDGRRLFARRWGARQHYSGEPWTDRVEVYFGRGIEAYVTPISRGVNVAWLWDADAGAIAPGASLASIVATHVPALVPHLIGRRPVGGLEAAGPFRQRPARRVGDGVVLLGDAGGYVDPLTGEGVGLALMQAEMLVNAIAPCLADADDAVVPARDLAPCARAIDRASRSNRILTTMLLRIARRPAAVESAIAALAADPALFRYCLDVNMGRRAPWRVPIASALRLARVCLEHGINGRVAAIMVSEDSHDASFPSSSCVGRRPDDDRCCRGGRGSLVRRGQSQG